MYITEHCFICTRDCLPRPCGRESPSRQNLSHPPSLGHNSMDCPSLLLKPAHAWNSLWTDSLVTHPSNQHLENTWNTDICANLAWLLFRELACLGTPWQWLSRHFGNKASDSDPRLNSITGPQAYCPTGSDRSRMNDWLSLDIHYGSTHMHTESLKFTEVPWRRD